jgi:sec-independent protein translocase protein TatA
MDLFAPTHLLILLLIILVIFGPSKLGDVGGALGKAIRDFKKAMNDEPPVTNQAKQASTAETAATAVIEPKPEKPA